MAVYSRILQAVTSFANPQQWNVVDIITQRFTERTYVCRLGRLPSGGASDIVFIDGTTPHPPHVHCSDAYVQVWAHHGMGRIVVGDQEHPFRVGAHLIFPAHAGHGFILDASAWILLFSNQMEALLRNNGEIDFHYVDGTKILDIAVTSLADR